MPRRKMMKVHTSPYPGEETDLEKECAYDCPNEFQTSHRLGPSISIIWDEKEYIK